MELNWVRTQGRKDVPGKPIQYGTTDDFLSHFNLQKLSDLPTFDELGTAGLIDTSSMLMLQYLVQVNSTKRNKETKRKIYIQI